MNRHAEHVHLTLAWHRSVTLKLPWGGAYIKEHWLRTHTLLRAAALQGRQPSGCSYPTVVQLTVSCCLQLFHDSGSGVPYGPKWAAGDTVGAGWNLQRQEIFFT